jgi:hypothetical protein
MTTNDKIRQHPQDSRRRTLGEIDDLAFRFDGKAPSHGQRVLDSPMLAERPKQISPQVGRCILEGIQKSFTIGGPELIEQANEW